MLVEHLDEIKSRCGIVSEIAVYDSEIKGLLDDVEHDLLASGVSQEVIDDTEHTQQIITAAALYVKAYLGNDRTDTAQYLDMYRAKVFRLTLEDSDDVEQVD